MTIYGLALWIDMGLVYAILAGAAVAMPLIVLFSPQFERWRLRAIAAELGMKFDPKAQTLRALGCERLWKFRYWNDRRYLLHGTVNGIETIIVHVREVDPKEEPMQRPGFYQLVCFRLPGRSLPTFHLIKYSGNRQAVLGSLPGGWELALYEVAAATERARQEAGPESALRLALEELKKKEPTMKTRERHEVELNDNPGFSSHFLLSFERKEDEPALRKVFTREVQDFFMQTRDEKWWEVQGAGDWIGFGSTAVNVPLTSKPYRRMLDEARQLHEVLARGTAREHKVGQ